MKVDSLMIYSWREGKSCILTPLDFLLVSNAMVETLVHYKHESQFDSVML